MPNDYYIILGIDRGADLSQIKQAYRKTIKRYHPDTVGGDTHSRKFIEAQEAYEVLSDTNKRRAYDADLLHQDIPPGRTGPVETIIRRRPPGSSFRHRPTVVDDFFEGIVPGFYRDPTPTGPRHKDLYLQAVLTPEEALHGGIFPVAVPVREPCLNCRQSGWWEAYFCPTCKGRRIIESLREFNLVIPPEIRTDTTVEVAMDGIGLRDVRLFVDIVVGQAPFA